jgi:starvation-inducible outer membrane lipoprotein
MNLSLVTVSTISACVILGGCDSKSDTLEAADQAAAESFSEFSKKNTDQIADRIKSEGMYTPESTESIDEYVELVEETSKNVSPELAAQLNSQALILAEFKAMMDPFILVNNELTNLGGIDASTLGSIEDVDNRIAMIEQLNETNELIDLKFPVLFKQINGADSPEGKQQLAMAKEMRATNREAYPHMKESLQIVKKYWETSGNADDGKFYFGDDVPNDVVEAYNNHLAAVDAIGLRQSEIQRKYYKVP